MNKKVKNGLPFGFEKPQDSLGFLLWQTTIIWQRALKKELEPHDITHAQFVIMALLLWCSSHGYHITQILLVQWSKLDKMTVSASLKKLVELELVDRAPDEVDTRAKNVSLTSRGKKVVLQLIPLVEAVDAKFFGAVLETEQKTLLSILGKLIPTE